MRTNIEDLRSGIAKAADMARELFDPCSAEFAVFMCGILSAAFDDLAEHVQELERKVLSEATTPE
jgi:hypothetical protein